MGRRTELLEAAAAALDDGEDPFAGGFLSEHDVSLDEAYSLAQQLAIGARVVAYGLDHPKTNEGMAVMFTLARGVT